MPKRGRRAEDVDEEDEEGDDEVGAVNPRAKKSAKVDKGKGRARDGEDESDSDGMEENDAAAVKAGGMVIRTEEEKLKFRQQLRANQEEAREMNANIDTVKPSELLRNLRKQRRLFSGVDLAADAGIDSTTLKLNSDTATKLGKAIRATSNSFDLIGWLGSLKINLGQDLAVDEEAEDDEGGQAPNVRKNGALGDWEKVGWMAAKRTRKVIGVEFMYGQMAVEPKKRVVNRKARQKGLVAGPEVRPIEMRQEDMTKAENDSMKIVKNMDVLLEELTSKALDAGNYINFFEWFINPQSFAQTVENLFYTSFLIREGKASLDFDEEQGCPTIMAAEPPSKEDLKTGKMKKRQVVMEMTQADWKKAIDLFGIKTPLVPHRLYENGGVQPDGARWY